MRNWTDTCRGCGGQCCCSYPLPRDLLARFADRFQVPCDLLELDDDEYAMPLTPDGRCVFLARHDGTCVIYRDRPLVCRAYGEIEEVPCARLNPTAAVLAAEQMARRIAKRLGIDLGHVEGRIYAKR